MKQFNICVGIFVVLAASRFIPHPPNFTSLIALSFYVPALLGMRYIPAVVISFAITDFIIGYHSGTHWTWGSVLIIGFVSSYFTRDLFFRLFGAVFAGVIFFIITNFGVWTSGMYGYTFKGLLNCFVLAIPFFTYTLISTLIYSVIIETFFKIYKVKILKI